jgi:hypothetical protein
METISLQERSHVLIDGLKIGEGMMALMENQLHLSLFKVPCLDTLLSKKIEVQGIIPH